MRFLRSPKCSKTIVELTFTTQKANACSLLDWLFCSVVPFLGKFGQKTQNCQFKLKFGTQTNSNMQNSMVMFTFSLFDWKYLFWVNLVQKNQNCQFELKFGTQTNFNMQNSMVVFTFSVLDQKNPFLANLVQKIKIVCSK